MENLQKFFWFHKDHNHLSNALLAVMLTSNGPEYMKTKDRSKPFDRRNVTVKSISQNMNHTYTSIQFNSLLKIIELIYKDGYTVTKNRYIRNERSDIMDAVRIIEHQWIKYLYKKHSLEFSMEFEDMRLD